jgi:O-antigen/teichoic acid export membrane protein
MRRVLLRTMIAVCSVVGVLCAMLVFGGGALLAMIYNQRFEGAQQIVSVLSLNLFMYAVSMSAENGLLALGRPKAICSAHVIGLIVTMIAAVVLIKTNGVLGAAIAGVIGQTVATVWKCLLLGIIVREHTEKEPAIPALEFNH